MQIIINPNTSFYSELTAIEPPLWALMIASEWYEDCVLIDAEAENLSFGEIVDRVKRIQPESVLICVMGRNPSVSSTPKMPISTELARVLGQFYKVIFTGLHPQAVPTVSVAGVNCEVNAFLPLMESPLRWELLPMDKYRAHNWHCLDGSPRSPYGVTYTSVGCPYNCYYCNIHALYPDRKLRLRPTELVIQDIENLVTKYNVRNIKFWDELFASEEQHVVDICQSIISKGFDLNIWAYARVDTITEKMLTNMRKAGINWLCYGFESADIEVRRKLNKRFGNDRMTEAIKMTKDAGINILGNFMFGLPNETEDAMKASSDFARENLFEFVNFYVALPYPGSDWYKDTKGNSEWSSFDQLDLPSSPAKTFRDKAYKEYFTNPDYLSLISRKFGQPGLEVIKGLKL